MDGGKPNHLASSTIKKCTSAHEQCTGTGLGNGGKGCVDFLLAAGFNRHDFLSHGASGVLNFAGLYLECRRGWVLQNSDGFGLGNQLTQECKPFAYDRDVIETHAGHIAVRSIKTRYKAHCYRIGTGNENDRHEIGRAHD